MKILQKKFLEQLNRPLSELSLQKIGQMINAEDSEDAREFKAVLTENINQFKKRCIKTLPLMASPAVEAKHWQKLYLQFINKTVERITSMYLYYSLINLGLDPEKLKEKRPERQGSKRDFDNISNQTQPFSISKRTRALRQLTNITDKPVILNQPSASAVPYSPANSLPRFSMFKPLTKITDKQHPSYPELFQSPGGKEYYEMGSVDDQSLYLEVTPSKERSFLTNSPERKGPVHINSKSYTVTLKNIEERTKQRRYPSQQEAFGRPAQQCFRSMGDENAPNKTGRDFHLAHLHAFSQGGAQRRDNLYPTTASANYKTLAYVEKTIEKLLKTQQTMLVEVNGVRHYSSQQADIPFFVQYQLSWMDSAGKTHSEHFNIDPRYHGKVNSNASRFLKEIHENESSNDNPTTRKLF